MYIELKSNWNTDSCNAKHEKFRLLTEFKINNPDCQVMYICLNDNKSKDGVDYIYQKNLFRIITGDKAWKYLCDIAEIKQDELILIIRNNLNEKKSSGVKTFVRPADAKGLLYLSLIVLLFFIEDMIGVKYLRKNGLENFNTIPCLPISPALLSSNFSCA